MRILKFIMLVTWPGFMLGTVIGYWAWHQARVDYRALLETRTGEVLNEPLHYDKTLKPYYSAQSGEVKILPPPPYTGWIDNTFGTPPIYFRSNQPCAMYRQIGQMFSVAFDSDTEPIRMYRTEREARHAVEQGCSTVEVK